MTSDKRLVVLGAGIAGTTIVNKLSGRLREDWTIQVVEPSSRHVYQPGLLFVPFGRGDPGKLTRPTHGLIADDVELIVGEVDRVVTAENRVSWWTARPCSTTSW